MYETPNLRLRKLSVPLAAPQRISRRRLIQRLNSGLAFGRHVTLVSAPAGFGKTTCIVDWIATLNSPVAWLTLDEADDDPGQFFTYLIAALQQIDRGIGADLAGLLRGGQLPPADIISTTVSNDIGRMAHRFLLVLDNLQSVQDSAIFQVLQSLITAMPQPLHLVLITREDPPLPLARLRAHNQLTEIRAADLRFNKVESAQFLNVVMGIALSEHDVAHLVDKTEGWIVGLQLAGLSMQNRADPTAVVAGLQGTHHFILSYLTEEVLNRQTPVVRLFLLKTSILDTLHGDLCNAVTGRNDSKRLLEKLFNANLFLIPGDENRRWFRFHNLFAELLRDRLQQQSDIDSAKLHRRAASWYAQANMPTEAVQHALISADYRLAVDLIETHAMTMLMQWHAKTVRGWIEALPGAWAAQSLKTNLAFAWMHLFGGDFALAMPYIDRLQTVFAAKSESEFEPSVTGEWLALQAAMLNAQGQAEASLALSQRALSLVPEDAVYVRGLIFSFLAGAYQALGDLESTETAYWQIIHYGRAAGNLATEMMGFSGLGLLALHQGRLRFAYDVASQALLRIENSDALPPICAAIYGELAGVYYMWRQLDEAELFFRRSAELSTMSGFSDADVYYHVVQSKLRLAEGDVEAAVAAIRRGTEMQQQDAPAAVREELIYQQVRVYLAQGNPDSAENALKQAGFIVPDDVAAFTSNATRVELLLFVARQRIALHRIESGTSQKFIGHALDNVSLLVDSCREQGFSPLTIEALLLRAQMHVAAGNKQTAYVDLKVAVKSAETENMLSVFVDEGVSVLDMLNQMALQGGTDRERLPFVERIIHAFPEQIRARATNRQPLVDPLTERELEVLRHMADGLTYQGVS